MRIVKVILIALLSLIVAVAIMWGVLYYLVWPKPEIPGLIPGAPLTYIAASHLDEIISAVGKSEFANRAARSPLWKDFESSRIWSQISLQKRAWEKWTGEPIDLDGFMQLVKKDALLAFYAAANDLYLNGFASQAELASLPLRAESDRSEQDLSLLFRNEDEIIFFERAEGPVFEDGPALLRGSLDPKALWHLIPRPTNVDRFPLSLPAHGSRDGEPSPQPNGCLRSGHFDQGDKLSSSTKARKENSEEANKQSSSPSAISL